MTALAADKGRTRYGQPITLGRSLMAATTTIYGGSLVCSNAAGYLVVGSTATGLIARGVAILKCVNTGAAGAMECGFEEGDFEFENSAAADALAQAEVGDTVYIVDDNTVAKTDGTGTRSAAGKLIGFNPDNGKPIVRVTSPIF